MQLVSSLFLPLPLEAPSTSEYLHASRRMTHGAPVSWDAGTSLPLPSPACWVPIQTSRPSSEAALSLEAFP